MYRNPKIGVAQKAAKTAVAALLSFLLVLSALVSVSHVLHEKLHAGDAAPGHFCLVCSLSKGQVSAEESAPILAIFAAAAIFVFPLFQLIQLPLTDRWLAPNRGPPAAPSSRRVVG